MKTRRRQLALLLTAVVLSLPSLAQSEAEAAVQRFLMARSERLGDKPELTLHVGALKLNDCRSPEAFLPAGERTPRWGRVSVGLRCADGATRYLQAEIKVIGDYLVPAQTIAAGTVVNASHLRTERGDLSKLPHNALRDSRQIVGQTARHTLSAGRPIQTQQLHTPALVRPGQAVTIISGGAGFQIARSGEAMDAGGLGEAVRVRIGPRQLLNGVVSAAGEVRVEL